MNFNIEKASVKFIAGFSSPSQFIKWIETHKFIIGFSFIGRSNVGKSSLINALFGKSTAKTSKTPGRTREINLFEFYLADTDKEKIGPFYFFDLPGYGHAKVSKQIVENWNALMNAFFQNVPSSVLLIQLQDARHPDQKADQSFTDYIKDYDLNLFLVLNKIDKLKNQKSRAQLKKLEPQIFKNYKHAKQIFYVSAEKRIGLEQLETSLVNNLQLQV